MKKKKNYERPTVRYDIVEYGVTMDLQKKSFIELAKSCPHWLKITLWKLVQLVQKCRIAT